MYFLNIFTKEILLILRKVLDQNILDFILLAYL